MSKSTYYNCTVHFLYNLEVKTEKNVPLDALAREKEEKVAKKEGEGKVAFETTEPFDVGIS